MSDLRIGLGHGLTFEQTSVLDPQPQSPNGVTFAQRDFGADLTVYQAGLHIVLLWPVFDGESQYQALLAQIGLDDSERQAVTGWFPNRRLVWGLYNGWAIFPQQTTYAIFPTGLSVVVNQLVQIGS